MRNKYSFYPKHYSGAKDNTQIEILWCLKNDQHVGSYQAC